MRNKSNSIPLVRLEDLVVDYEMKKYSLRAVGNVSFEIKRNAITALVGESGSGKSTVAASLINCLVEPGRIVAGKIVFQDDKQMVDVVQLSKERLRRFRWNEISMVFQGAQSSLNPVVTIYNQFKETLRVHRDSITEKEIKQRCCEVLDIVNLDANRILGMYPHELSGGMKQRVMIAFSILLNPQLIILDEPTTALDVITQNYIFDIFRKINQDMGISMLLLTHDIGIVAKYADYVGVMYAGQVMEFGDIYTIFGQRYHPYTEGLIRATPSLHVPVEEMKPIGGTPPDLAALPQGCVFSPRCPEAMDVCYKERPQDYFPEQDHLVKCHLYGKDRRDAR